jgi:hypothetical protein
LSHGVRCLLYQMQNIGAFSSLAHSGLDGNRKPWLKHFIGRWNRSKKEEKQNCFEIN